MQHCVHTLGHLQYRKGIEIIETERTTKVMVLVAYGGNM
jgi:hypothetical protein